ncbi:hypothetical protein ACHAXM_003946 [Skeletonema potamos]
MITPFSYLLFLFSLLLIYLGFLILPRGFKAQYCLGSRRRYRRNRRRRSTTSPKVHPDEETPSINDNSCQENIYSDSIWNGVNEKISAAIHPPPNNVNVRSLLEERVRRRLAQPPGLRLIAHGIKVRPRPVWIQLHADHNQNKQGSTSEFHNCLTWRAELKTSSQDEGTLSSNTPCLGSIRKVSLTDIVGFEMGQKTVALKRLSTEKSVRESDCFSILTNAGTLDLQCVSSSDMGRASAEDVRETLLHYLSRIMPSSNSESDTILSARTNTNTVSTVSF